MGWVKEQYIETEGFPRELLKHIKTACDTDKVEWIKGSLVVNGNTCSGVFEWLGGMFCMTEINDSIRSIKLAGGKLDDEELTMLVLKG